LKEAVLGKICDINPRLEKNLGLDLVCSFIPMDYVDEISGTIRDRSVRPVSEVAKGYTAFIEGDVLFAKITPCMKNGKCTIAKNLINGRGFGSTEFHVIRPTESITSNWIFYFLRQTKIRQDAERNMTGSAGQKRVPTQYISELKIPLPSFEEQERIARILAKCDRLRRTRRYTQQLSDTYLQSVFLEMFGDLAENLKNWKKSTIEAISNKVTDGEHSTPQRTTEGIKLLSARNIQNGYLDFSPGLDFIPEYEYQRISKRCNPELGDVLMSCSGTVGRVATLNISGPISMVRSVALIKPKHDVVESKFLEYFLRNKYTQRLIKQSSHQSSQANIFTGQIKELPVLLPPLSLQSKFALSVQKYDRLRTQQREATRQAEHLFQTTLHRAFSGEL
jgi:type I restriction enzyme, S subunit